jgi:predicted transcriptional regulator
MIFSSTINKLSKKSPKARDTNTDEIEEPEYNLKERIIILLSDGPKCLSRISLALDHPITEIRSSIEKLVREGIIEKREYIMQYPDLQMYGIARPSFFKKKDGN